MNREALNGALSVVGRSFGFLAVAIIMAYMTKKVIIWGGDNPFLDPNLMGAMVIFFWAVNLGSYLCEEESNRHYALYVEREKNRKAYYDTH